MTTPNFMMITVAKCSPDFIKEATGLTAQLADELKANAGAVSTGVGVIATGDEAGSLMLVQSYEKLSGIDAAFQVYDGSSTYSTLVGSGNLEVSLRNVVHLTSLGWSNSTGKAPAYGVFTRMQTPGVMLEEASALTHHFEANGVMVLRYGTVITGTNAGSRLLVAAYPSMDAIENTYSALSEDPKYHAFLEKAMVGFRNIIRVTA